MVLGRCFNLSFTFISPLVHLIPTLHYLIYLHKSMKGTVYVEISPLSTRSRRRSPSPETTPNKRKRFDIDKVQTSPSTFPLSHFKYLNLLLDTFLTSTSAVCIINMS